MPCVACIYISFGVILYSPVDHELGGDRQYLDDQFPYPAKEGKHSPTSLIPFFKVFYLHAIQIYFVAPIVACGTCLKFLSTAPSMTSVGLSRIARAVISCVCLAAIYIS